MKTVFFLSLGTFSRGLSGFHLTGCILGFREEWLGLGQMHLKCGDVGMFFGCSRILKPSDVHRIRNKWNRYKMGKSWQINYINYTSAILHSYVMLNNQRVHRTSAFPGSTYRLRLRSACSVANKRLSLEFDARCKGSFVSDFECGNIHHLRGVYGASMGNLWVICFIIVS